MSKKSPRTSNIRQGQTIYRVYVIGKSSFMVTCKVKGRPYEHPNMPRCMYVDTSDNGFFLSDSGISTKRKTFNRAFFSRKKATSYRDKCIITDLGGKEFQERRDHVSNFYTW